MIDTLGSLEDQYVPSKAHFYQHHVLRKRPRMILPLLLFNRAGTASRSFDYANGQTRSCVE